jgi:hypothetical protein
MQQILKVGMGIFGEYLNSLKTDCSDKSTLKFAKLVSMAKDDRLFPTGSHWC